MIVRVWGFLRICLVAGAALGAWSVPMAAVGTSSAQEALAPAISLSHRAEQLKAAFNSGDPAAIQAAIQEVEVLRRTYNTLDVLPLVESMAIYARDLGNHNRAELGLEVVQTVERWAPKYPTLLGTRVILLRQEGFAGGLWSMAEVLELTRLRLAHPMHRWLWLLQHIAWLRLMATLLLWGWALTMALRYRRVWRYLWEEPLARFGIHSHVAALLGAFLVTLPVLVGLDPSLVAMLWLIMLAPFLLPLEIRATLLVIALQLAHPALAFLEPMAAQRPEPSIVTLQLRPQPLPVDSRALAGLPAGDQVFLAGWRQLQFQRWDLAEKTFQGLAKSHSDHAEVMNNLGVARFQLGDLAGAQACFDEAFGVAPTRVEVLLNQSMVAFKQMDGPLGASKQEDAHSASPETFTRLLAANQALNDQRTFPMPLPDSPLRVEVMRASLAAGGAPAGKGVNENSLLFSLAMPLLALGCFALRHRKSIHETHPSQCTRCGDPFHTSDSPDAFVCTKCHHLFVLKDGLHAENRKTKVDEVAAYQGAQRWIHRSLMVLLPGVDRCFIGDTSQGFVEYGVLCFALGIVLATGRSVRYPGEILADPTSVWLPLGLLLLTVLFVRSWLKLLPRRF